MNFSNFFEWALYLGMVYSNTSYAMHLSLYINQLAGKAQEKTFSSMVWRRIFSANNLSNYQN